MRYRVRRIEVWSAAKLGSFVGLVAGVVVGTLLAGLGQTLAPTLAELGQPVEISGWIVVLAAAVLVGSLAAAGSAVVALIYNFVSRLGASLVLDLDLPDEARSGRGTSPADTMLDSPAFSSSIFDSGPSAGPSTK